MTHFSTSKSDRKRPDEETSSDSSESENESEIRRTQVKVDIDLWKDEEPQIVNELPDDIDGTVIYEMKGLSQKSEIVLALKDGRKWKKNCPTTWSGHSRVRYADCKGSHKCIATDCPFKVQYGVTNRTQFTKSKSRKGSFECKGCGKTAL